MGISKIGTDGISSSPSIASPTLSGTVTMTGLAANTVPVISSSNTVVGIAPGTSGNVLTSNGTSWSSGAGVADGSITTAKLADSGVTTAKLADSGVTTAKITDANVTTAKLADSGVTTAKLADSSVTYTKLASLARAKIRQIVTGSASAGGSISSGAGATDTGLSATITLSSTASQVLGIVQFGNIYQAGGGGTTMGIEFHTRRVVGGSIVATPSSACAGAPYTSTSSQVVISAGGATFLDSPASTAALTYKVQIQHHGGSGTVNFHQNNAASMIVLFEVAND